MAKPNESVSITSPTHAIALMAYFVAFLQGIAFATGTASARGIENIIGDRNILFYLWSYCFAIFSALGFVAAITSQYFRRPNTILKIELVGIIGLGLANLFYFISLQKQGFESDSVSDIAFLKGFTFVITTQLYALGFAVGALVRAIQIGLDLRKIGALVDQKVRDEVSTEG